MAAEALLGLACANCGGMVPIPEGQPVVKCPFCEQRALVQGERGLRRYQMPRRVDRETALETLRGFLSGNWAIARDAKRRARLSEAFVAYVPFWTVWARVLGWVFGKEKVGSGKNKRYVPREVKIAQQMNWNQAACDIGEFGVNQIIMPRDQVEPFDPEALHETGMVFEPIGSQTEAENAARDSFMERAKNMSGVDRISQGFYRLVRRKIGLVYYPLWVMRYLYRGRAFQVVVDGYSGRVLFGRAPGDTLFRAGVLVAGMLIGAIIAVDVAALLFLAAFEGSDNGELALFALGAIVAGFAIMVAAYRRFRYGEAYEYAEKPEKRRRVRRRKERGVHRAEETFT